MKFYKKKKYFQRKKQRKKFYYFYKTPIRYILFFPIFISFRSFYISRVKKKNETTVNFFYENLFLKTIYKTVTDY